MFDASAKWKGPGLYECLYKGASLNPLLSDVLLRFRVSSLGLAADIEAAYLQISVPAEERVHLRFPIYASDFRCKWFSISSERCGEVAC